MKEIIIILLIVVLCYLTYKTFFYKENFNTNLENIILQENSPELVLDNASKMIDSDNVEISDLNKNITDDLLSQLFTDNIENSNFDTGQIHNNESLNNEDIKKKNKKLRQDINKISFEQDKTLDNIKNELVKIISLREPINLLKQKYENEDIKILKNKIKIIEKNLSFKDVKSDETTLSEFTKSKINIANMYNNIAVIYNNNGNYEDALDNIDIALKYVNNDKTNKKFANMNLDKTKAVILKNKGLILKENNKPKEAKNSFEEGIELLKKHSKNYNNAPFKNKNNKKSEIIDELNFLIDSI